MKTPEEWREEMKKRFVKPHIIDWECYRTIAAEIQADALSTHTAPMGHEHG